MADWYVSSAVYAGIAVFATSHAYSIGDFVKPTAPTSRAMYTFRCSVAGTSSTEPSWNTANNGTNTTGTATFVNVTGQSAFFWSAPAGDAATLCYNGSGQSRIAAGDRLFVSSDHSETTNGVIYGAGTLGSGWGLVQWYCVNRAGSTPPVAADVTTGAVFASTSAFTNGIGTTVNCFMQGFTFRADTGTGYISIGETSGTRTAYLKNCTFICNSGQIRLVYTKAILDNPTFIMNVATNPMMLAFSSELEWINGGSVSGTNIPTALFANTSSGGSFYITCRGADLSAVTTKLVNAQWPPSRYYFESCKIASTVTRMALLSTSFTQQSDEVDLVNCDDGTHILSERYTTAGSVTSEYSIYLTGGAQDDWANYSHKLSTNTSGSGLGTDKFCYPLHSFWMDTEVQVTGATKTATVEIISSGSLNNDDIALHLEFMGTGGSSLASFTSSFIATPLTAASTVTSSSASWNASPATPVKQKLTCSFTPQVPGRVRGQVRLGKSSVVVYVNPQLVVT